MRPSLRNLACIAAFSMALAAAPIAHAAPAAVAGGTSQAVQVAVVLAVLAVIPAILISTTSFVRIVIVLAMVRHAFGMPQTPPNAVLTSLALFMTAFVMGPTLSQLNQDAVQPLLGGKAELGEVMDKGSAPLKSFMLKHTRDRDIEMIYEIAQAPLPERTEDIDLFKLTPAFMLNELRVSFTIGFVILLPFLLIDLVVASILLALGMMMVPPATISLPIKVLMFVLIDGWSLVLEGLLGSFG